MECDEVARIQEKLQVLYDVFSRIVPVTNLHDHPFTFHSKKIQNITCFIGQMIEQAMGEQQAQEQENSEIEKRIELYCRQLTIPMPEIRRIPNVNLQKEYLENELRRVMVARDHVESEINILRAETRATRDWLGHEPKTEDDAEISLDRVNFLRNELAVLNDEKAKKEGRRQAFYDEIEESSALLKRQVNFTFDEKICVLEATAARLRGEIQDNREEFRNALNEIRKREKYLDIVPQAFAEACDAGAIDRMKKHSAHLKLEQDRLFDQIFGKVKAELFEINKIFGIASDDYPPTEESLDKMRDQINLLLPKKDMFCEIAGLVDKRQLLLQKMTEFEKIASDPKRLFKSSFQLNTEEKFRNTAYPSLLKLEENIFECIDSYEKSFGKFYFGGEEYKTNLKAEIDNRIINRTVFISRCDSPYRKRK